VCEFLTIKAKDKNYLEIELPFLIREENFLKKLQPYDVDIIITRKKNFTAAQEIRLQYLSELKRKKM